jgi:hypothetical protein
MWTSLNGVGLGFNTLFSYNLMMSSIIGKMYNFKAKYPEEREKKKKEKKKKDKDVKKNQPDLKDKDDDHDEEKRK